MKLLPALLFLSFSASASTLTCTTYPSYSPTCNVSGPLDYTGLVTLTSGGLNIQLITAASSRLLMDSDTLTLQFTLPDDSYNWSGTETAGDSFLGASQEIEVQDGSTETSIVCCTMGEVGYWTFDHTYGDQLIVTASVSTQDYDGDGNSAEMFLSFGDPGPTEVPEPETLALVGLLMFAVSIWVIWKTRREGE